MKNPPQPGELFEESLSQGKCDFKRGTSARHRPCPQGLVQEVERYKQGGMKKRSKWTTGTAKERILVQNKESLRRKKKWGKEKKKNASRLLWSFL